MCSQLHPVVLGCGIFIQVHWHHTTIHLHWLPFDCISNHFGIPNANPSWVRIKCIRNSVPGSTLVDGIHRTGSRFGCCLVLLFAKALKNVGTPIADRGKRSKSKALGPAGLLGWKSRNLFLLFVRSLLVLPSRESLQKWFRRSSVHLLCGACPRLCRLDGSG